MTKDEALDLALEALTYIYTETTADEDELIHAAIKAIKQALAAPVQKLADCCANCLRTEHEHQEGRCPKPFTTIWHAWDYDFPPTEPVAYTTGHCKQKAQPGGCQLHNLHCGYPACDRKAAATPPAQPAPVQPLAYLYHDATSPELANPMFHSTLLVFASDRRPELCGETPLYTTPPAAQRQWVGLTDEDVSDLCGEASSFGTSSWIRHIEAKLKEKNT